MRINYVFTGEEERDADGRYIIPQNATHVSIDESVKVIPIGLFVQHQNIVELICHDGVERIEESAFYNCPCLKRAILLGVKVVELEAFLECFELTDVECRKLESIGQWAFAATSLGSINLPSVKVVEDKAFDDCHAMKKATFGSELESIGEEVFRDCPSLERIIIPLRLKYGVFTADNIFEDCEKLERIDLVEKEALNETINALQLEEWRNDMNEEIDAINETLPIKRGMNRVIRWWIESVLRKINHYKEEHRYILNEATSTLTLGNALPKDIVVNDVLPFLELPPHTFDGEDERPPSAILP